MLVLSTKTNKNYQKLDETKLDFNKMEKKKIKPECLFNIFIEPCISKVENSSLIVIPSKEKIWITISKMNQWGDPGPDGFHPGFFKSNWDIMGPELNHSFITPIPKIANP